MLKQHLDPIEKRGVLETLRRIISRLNEIFRYAATEELIEFGNDSNLLIVFYVQIMPDDFVMQLHRF